MAIADGMGVRVLHGALPYENGIYYDELRLILLNSSMSSTLELCTLGHELGHAHYRHESTTEATEAAANKYAASILIDDREYAAAEAMSDSPLFIAQELGVTLSIVQAYSPSFRSARAK